MTTKKLLIGVTAPARSGKDTIGDYLVNEKGYTKYSFANPLKRAAMEIFGFTEKQVFGSLKETVDPIWGVTPRLVLQVMGTELFQYDIQKHIPEFEKIGRGIWVERFKLWYKENSDKNIVICDVRFKHEAEAITQLGGEIWRVERPSLSLTDTHASETELSQIPFNHKFMNDGSIEQLQSKIDLYFFKKMQRELLPLLDDEIKD